MPKLLTLLPHFNALLNSTSAILLVSGYRAIREGRIKAHRNFQIAAVISSTVFLVSYLTYHYYHGTSRFLGQGIVRRIYFSILISHTILAIVIVPLVIVTLLLAALASFRWHRRIARVTLPIWLYVSVTGVIVYLLLYQIYPSP